MAPRVGELDEVQAGRRLGGRVHIPISDFRFLNYRIVRGSHNTISGKIISRMVVIKIASIRIEVPV